jgi:hypothetical protein
MLLSFFIYVIVNISSSVCVVPYKRVSYRLSKQATAIDGGSSPDKICEVSECNGREYEGDVMMKAIRTSETSVNFYETLW